MLCKGKKSCWKLLIKNEQFLKAFSQLGNTCDLETDVIDKLEEYVCCLYGSKKRSVNDARFVVFVLYVFMLRGRTMWTNTENSNLHCTSHHISWKECRSFPDDINGLLIYEGEEDEENVDRDSDYGFRSDIESDEDDELF